MVKLLKEELVPSLRGAPIGFTGTVWRDEIARGGQPDDIRVYRVSFEPGSRTAWHTHPSWQVLHVLSGIGRVQSRGGELLVLRPGDTAWIEPDEVHWHGASPDHSFVHIAIHQATDKDVEVGWLEQVSPQDYR